MIGAVGDAAYSGNRGTVEQGRRAEAVGQQAKAAIAAAREAGAELPKNAQGIAASGIARGADPSSIFAALVGPVGEAGDTPDTGGVTTTPPQEGGDAEIPVDVIVQPPSDSEPTAPVEEPPEDESLVQVAVSEPVLAVDDGAIALELLDGSAP